MERYTKEKKLGQGAMVAVYLVRRSPDNARLALKMVAVASSKDRQVALNEIKILSALEHPHIVRFEDSFVEGDELCIGTSPTAMRAR